MWTQIGTIGVKPLISIIVQRVTTQPQLSLLSLFTIQHVGLSCRRAVCAVGVACARGDIKREFRKNAKDKRKKWAVQM